MIITSDIILRCIKDYDSYLKTNEQLLNEGHIDEYSYSFVNYIDNIQFIAEYDCDHDYNYIHIIKFYFKCKSFSNFSIFFRHDSISYWEEPKSRFIQNIQDLCTEEQVFQKTLVSAYANRFTFEEYIKITDACNDIRKTLDMVTADE